MYEYQAYKFCPRCGESFQEREPAKSQCASCGLSMYHSAKQGVIVVLRDDQGRLGLSRRAVEPRKGCIDPVGGFVDAWETLEECGVREVREEIGLELSIDRLTYFGSAYHEYTYQEIGYPVIDSYFVADVTEAEKAAITIQEEVASFDWYDITSIDPKDYFYQAGYDLLYKTFAVMGNA